MDQGHDPDSGMGAAVPSDGRGDQEAGCTDRAAKELVDWQWFFRGIAKGRDTTRLIPTLAECRKQRSVVPTL